MLGRTSICSQLDSLAKSEAHKAPLYFLSWYISKSPQYSCFFLNEMEQSYSHQPSLSVLNVAATKLSLDNQELQFLLFVNFLFPSGLSLLEVLNSSLPFRSLLQSLKKLPRYLHQELIQTLLRMTIEENGNLV